MTVTNEVSNPRVIIHLWTKARINLKAYILICETVTFICFICVKSCLSWEKYAFGQWSKCSSQCHDVAEQVFQSFYESLIYKSAWEKVQVVKVLQSWKLQVFMMLQIKAIMHTKSRYIIIHYMIIYSDTWVQYKYFYCFFFFKLFELFRIIWTLSRMLKLPVSQN